MPQVWGAIPEEPGLPGLLGAVTGGITREAPLKRGCAGQKPANIGSHCLSVA